jgi:hypothetical protein
MATTTFTNGITLTDADWFNDLDRLHYDILNDPADLAALVATLGATNWTITGNLSVNGGTTIGNAAGDAFTIHPSAWTLSNSVTVTGTFANLGTVTTVDINGGTIDGTTIGGATPAAGAFTTLSAKGGNGGNLIVDNDGSAYTQQVFLRGGAANSGLDILVESGASSIRGLQVGPVNIMAAASAGTPLQIASFSSTGLAVTGALSCSTNLTVTGGTITTGSTTALSLATSGGTVAQFANVASQVNYWYLYGNATGNSPAIQVAGSDTNVDAAFSSKGTGALRFYTNAVTNEQVRITHTASADRYITLTGSNGGNPTIGTSAGGLGISSYVDLTGTDGSSVALYLVGGSAIRNTGVGAHFYLDTKATDGGNIYIRPQANTAAIFSPTGMSLVGFYEGTEQSAPAAPAANGYRIFAQDNGAGKTQLMVRFASGASQQIAIEP